MFELLDHALSGGRIISLSVIRQVTGTLTTTNGGRHVDRQTHLGQISPSRQLSPTVCVCVCVRASRREHEQHRQYLILFLTRAHVLLNGFTL